VKATVLVVPNNASGAAVPAQAFVNRFHFCPRWIGNRSMNLSKSSKDMLTWVVYRARQRVTTPREVLGLKSLGTLVPCWGSPTAPFLTIGIIARPASGS
jgi:hypothetical protein